MGKTVYSRYGNVYVFQGCFHPKSDPTGKNSDLTSTDQKVETGGTPKDHNVTIGCPLRQSLLHGSRNPLGNPPNKSVLFYLITVLNSVIEWNMCT